MGNEASQEGGGQPGEPGSAVSTAGAPGSISAPSGSGQLIKPSNGAAAGGGAATGPGAGINRLAGRPNQTDHVSGSRAGAQPGHGDSRAGTGGRAEPYRLATHESPHQPPPSPGLGQGQHAARRNLQVDVGGGRKGRSPSVSPDRGSAPTSPYSVPQIAPMPSSKLCPVCNTTELTNHDQPNFNTCTQCHSTVCNQCGFNPNPHLTEVQEWLCLNCQMQRALGMDMTTPRSKSQQQIHSPSHQAKPVPQPQPKPQPGPQGGPTPQQMRSDPQAHRGLPSHAQAQAPGRQEPMGRSPQLGMGGPIQGLAKAPSQPDLSRSSPIHQPGRQAQIRSAGSSPARQPAPPKEQPQDGLTGKLFGFGASLLNQASTLMSVDPTQGTQAPARVAQKVVFSDASSSANKPQGPAAVPGTVPGKQGGAPSHVGPHAPPQQHPAAHHQPAPPQQQSPHKQQQQQQQQQSPHKQQQQHHQPAPQQQQHPTHHQPAPPQQQHPTHHQPAPPQQQQQQQSPHKQQQHHQPARQEPAPKPKELEKPKANCPLCKTELNIGSAQQPPNYNSCTQCGTQVCNLCGFNPTPHLLEVRALVYFRPLGRRPDSFSRSQERPIHFCIPAALDPPKQWRRFCFH
ncbi:hypothetical protein AAFF_G00041810 [Aldrovandia affinis]|uniref:Zinc finger piccolo-type domain-containing protein n=1 Tax=Aldrovandia affinis TaxID=143900 RepID=A0AAD7WF52_9TELE|nr:hypothetical protein AAFF_G00041810 [Aldrovandia affinis]